MKERKGIDMRIAIGALIITGLLVVYAGPTFLAKQRQLAIQEAFTQLQQVSTQSCYSAERNSIISIDNPTLLKEKEDSPKLKAWRERTAALSEKRLTFSLALEDSGEFKDLVDTKISIDLPVLVCVANRYGAGGGR